MSTGLSIVLTLALSACGRYHTYVGNIWPVTPAIAMRATFQITSWTVDAKLSDPLLEGKAFLVSEHFLVTSAAICNGNPHSLTIHVRGTRYPVEIEHHNGVLCLVRTPHRIHDADGTLTTPLLIARSSPKFNSRLSNQHANGIRTSWHETTLSWTPFYGGMPVHDGCGIVGVMLGPAVSGRVPGSRIANAHDLHEFLVESLGMPGPNQFWELEPLPPEFIDNMMMNPWPTDKAGNERSMFARSPNDLNYGRGGCR